MEQSGNSDVVSSHVIFNQVGQCITRHNTSIKGTSRQKHWVQSLCSTSPGDTSPLLQPEASLFPRHFYPASNNDRRSILGAFLVNARKDPYKFATTLGHAWIRMTDPSSTTSTDPTYMCHGFDELGNVALNLCHS